MISHISIKDFAIIDSITLSFQEGLHILTGETGAGKSILIEAISLALGSRADTAFVQSGKEKAVIELAVESDDPSIMELLTQNGLEPSQSLLISREIHVGGKSICRINGDLVSVNFLNRLCKKLADIHGQYDHQSLLSPENHLSIVDAFDWLKLNPLKEQVSVLYQGFQRKKSELASLMKEQEDALRKRDFMQFELDEIKKSNPSLGEDEILSSELVLMQNHETIYANLASIYSLLYEDASSTQDKLGKSVQLFHAIESLSPDLQLLSSELSDCYYRLEDMQSGLRKARDSITFSPERLNETISRLEVLDRLKRKYGGSLSEVLSYAERLERDLLAVEHADELKDQLMSEVGRLEEQLLTSSLSLRQARQDVALEMQQKMNRELGELNFQNTELSISFQPLSAEGYHYTESGIDEIEFLIATNKGEAPKPLAKIASGGEISRIMLAMKRIVGEYDQIPTMIFDEIDSGISGMTASIVGRKLKQIASSHQVICITHLPQIAAYSDHHYRITKAEQEGRTLSMVLPLSQEEKVREVARLLGGLDVSETALKNAQELIREASL